MNMRTILRTSAALAATAIIAMAVASSSPSGFPDSVTVTIADGTGLSGAAEQLKDEGVIRSTFLYKAYAVLQGGKTGLKSGQYLFDEPQSSLRVAYRLVNGIEGFRRYKVTIPEGLASYDIARQIKRSIPTFDTKKFLELAIPQEGYLFPDTYFFPENLTPERAVAEMRVNFDRQTGKLTIPLTFLNKSFHDVITMASIVEEEASSTEDRRKIAGVLWRRLEIGMPLQVDPPFFYLFGKTSAELTKTDLATSSPYNTYKFTGLPPGPISNPGLDAISATVHPTDTDYLFFLAGADGRIYYAVDHDGHVRNKEKYLN